MDKELYRKFRMLSDRQFKSRTGVRCIFISTESSSMYFRKFINRPFIFNLIYREIKND